MPALVGRVGRPDDVVLPDRPVHADRALSDHGAERGIRPVDVVDRPDMRRDRVLDARETDDLDAARCIAAAGLNRKERDDLSVLVLQQLARVERSVGAYPLRAQLPNRCP